MARRSRKGPSRRARRRAPAGLRLIRDFLPPEGVPLKFEVAGIGMRFAAQITDVLITIAFITALLALLAILELVSWDGFVTLGALLLLFVRAPYYILTELLWNGQTLGKRMFGLRAISANGRSLSPYAV
ncbi:MAG: RDD family protein, partial [Pseudomonadota bacterium]